MANSNDADGDRGANLVVRDERNRDRPWRLVAWRHAKDIIFNRKRRNRPQQKMRSRLTTRTVVDRCLTAWAPIGAITIPIGLGILLASPAGVSAVAALMAAAKDDDAIRMLAIFCAINTAATISSSMYLIARHWTMGNLMEDQLRRLTSLTATVEHFDSDMEALLEQRKMATGRKKSNSPATFRNLHSYLGCNPRLWKEVDIVPVGNGRYRLVANPDFLNNWIERFTDPDLKQPELILFVNRENPAITEATGRTLLRFAKLLDVAKASGKAVDLSKIRIHLVESTDIQRSFFLVTRRVANRVVEVVLQYSRSIDEHSTGAVTDVETVEEIFDEREKEKFKWAISRYLRESRATTPQAIVSVFRDVLHADSFEPLAAQDWRERVEAIFLGLTVGDDDGITINGSEFQIRSDLYPWEERAQRKSEGTRRRSASRK
jgi:hypothetical protein